MKNYKSAIFASMQSTYTCKYKNTIGQRSHTFHVMGPRGIDKF